MPTNQHIPQQRPRKNRFATHAAKPSTSSTTAATPTSLPPSGVLLRKQRDCPIPRCTIGSDANTAPTPRRPDRLS